MKLRSQLDNRFVGAGVTYAFREDAEAYRDIKCKKVKFPNDVHDFDYGKLSSEVKSHKMSKEQIDKYLKDTYGI